MSYPHANNLSNPNCFSKATLKCVIRYPYLLKNHSPVFQLRTLFLTLSHPLKILILTIVSEAREALHKDSKFLMDLRDIAFLSSL